MSKLHFVTYFLVIIGGLNWLLQGALGWDISRFLGGPTALVSRVIYILVGVSAILELIAHKKACKSCESK